MPTTPAPDRLSSKELVHKAELMMHLTNQPLPFSDVTPTYVDWLVSNLRSLAGSVISQANPLD
jgi:hypothetical protein